jgi:hypothetical protein
MAVQSEVDKAGTKCSATHPTSMVFSSERPANWMTHLPAWDIRVALEQFPNAKSSFIAVTLWTVIQEVVVKQCDALGGVMDGLVSDPSRCNFHPEVLACGAPNTNSSTFLNPAQMANLRRIYTPWRKANNTFIYNGLSPGGEAGYSFLFNGETPQVGIDFTETLCERYSLGLHQDQRINYRSRRCHQCRWY